MNELKDPSLYINRELSWLRFNTRVLEEARSHIHPLLERLKFIAIYGTNLDEFYMIRVAGLQEMYKEGINATGSDQITPIQQLGEIRAYVHKELAEVEVLIKEIFTKLAIEGLLIKEYPDLNEEDKIKADDYFYQNLYPVILPIAVDATHPFPHLNNLSFGLIAKLKDNESGELKFGIVRIPRVLNRFVEVSKNHYVPIESLVKHHVEQLFAGYKLISATTFRVTRNADMVVEEDEAGDFLELLEEGIKSRRKGNFAKLSIQKTNDADLYEFITSHIRVDHEDIYTYSMPLAFGAFWEIVGIKDFAHLRYPTYTPKILPPFGTNESLFKVLDKQDVVTYQPFESFDPVVQFISQAAQDPDVLSIKMTLYRVGKDSPIVRALIDAAEEGKQVTALVELKARFDEENNLYWAKALEQAGAHVIYGIAGLKVHAKVAMVVKKCKEGLKQYVHLSTGNYNQASARIYTDVSLFTSRVDFATDATRFFHHLTGFSKITHLESLSMAPYQVKKHILELIEGETKAGANGRIIAKMNALVDSDVIRALYRASQAGVKIDLIIRGICCLRPKVAGISENIRVISIVGRYLEHARIFYFKHASPQIYFSSADWMTRNLENRIELLIPVHDENVNKKLFEILMLQANDNMQSRELFENGDYQRIKHGKEKIDSQRIMEDYVTSLYESLVKESASSKAQKIASKLLKES